MANTAKYDWDLIETEFTTGYFLTDPETGRVYHKYSTHAELANKYGCSIRTIQDRSGQNKWSLKREILQNKIKETLTERKISGLLSESARFDSLTLDKICKLHHILDAYLKQYNYLFTSQDMDEEQLNIKVQELDSVTKTLEKLQLIARRTLGEPVQGLTNLSEEINSLNAAVTKSDSKSRKNRIKQLTDKLTKKEKLKLEIEEKRKELLENNTFNNSNNSN